jgi:hypothetical protein
VLGKGGTVLAGLTSRPGALRVIDADKDSCWPGEAPLQWAQGGAPSLGHEIAVQNHTLDPGHGVSALVECPPGKVVVGGGMTVSPPVSGIVSDLSGPESVTSWRVEARNQNGNGFTATVSAKAICVLSS